MNRPMFATVLLAMAGTLAFSVAFSAPGAAQEAETAETLDYLSELPPLLDRELFFGNPQIASGQISPDGRSISFRKPLDGILNVWVKGIDEPFDAARPVTADTARPVPGYFWSADSEYILYVQDKGGNENFHVYAVDPDAEPSGDSEVPPSRDLTPLEEIQARIVAVPEDDPAHILVALNDRDPQLHDLYRLNIETAERELLRRNEENLAGYVADLDGEPRLGMRVDGEGNTDVLRLGQDSLEQIYTCGNEETCEPIRFHRDGERLYFETNKGDPDLTQLVLMDARTGEVEPVESDPEGEVDFGGAIFSEDTEELIATTYRGERTRYYPKDEAFERDLERARAELPEGDYNFRSMTRDGRYWLVSVTRDVQPSSTYLYEREAGTFDLLYEVRPEIEAGQMAEMRPVSYEARDGLEIPAYLTLPNGVDESGLAVVVLPHGGPWARDFWGFTNFAQFLANRGYAVLQPNFRGSTGYGERFLNLGNEEWGTGDMQHDITDGVNWLIDQGIADPERVAIMGGSYGGYATLAGLAFTPDLYAAGVDIVGPSNIITLLNAIPPYWAPIRAIFDVRVGDPEDAEDRERLEAQSPLNSVDRIRAPLLVIQGANDPRVDKRESDQMVVALRENGLPVEYMVAPDEGHGFANEDNNLAMQATIEEFLSEHLGGRYQESVPPEIDELLETLMVDVDTLSLPSAEEGSGEEGTGDDGSGDPGERITSFDGSGVEPETLTYDQTIETQGQSIEFEARRTVAEATREGEDVLVLIESAQTPQGTAIDSTFVDPATLVPIRRSIHQGQVVVELAFEDGEVTGMMDAGPQSQPIEASAEGTVFADGPALQTAVGTLGLAAGESATVRVFEPLQGRVANYRIRAVDTETIETPAGSFETMRHEMTPLEGSEGTEMWIATDDGRIVRLVQDLPAQMGGGTATSVLVEAGG